MSRRQKRARTIKPGSWKELGEALLAENRRRRKKLDEYASQTITLTRSAAMEGIAEVINDWPGPFREATVAEFSRAIVKRLGFE